MKISLLAARQVVLLGSVIFAVPLFAGSASEIAKAASVSTVLVVTEDRAGQPLSLGSGFVLKEGAIVTNLHVIDGAFRGYAKQVGNKKKHIIEGVSRTDKQHDLVIL